jgi:hypothetical protein
MSMHFARRNASSTAVHDIGGSIISLRPEADYFDFKTAESVQNWRKKWFYIRDEKVEGQKYGLAPFDPTKKVVKLRSWDQKPSSTELEETEPLIAWIHALQHTKLKEVSGLQLMSLVIRRRVQHLQARISAMWSYSGKDDKTRISKKDYSTNEVEKTIRSFTRLTQKDEIPSACRLKPFDKKHPPPAVSCRVLLLFCRLVSYFTSLFIS